MPAESLQILGGALQSIFGGKKAKKYQGELEGMVNNYKPDAGIMDYYNKALQKYNMNPYKSALYNMQQEQIKGGTAQGIGALKDRRSALAGIPALIQNQNDSLLKAGAVAEGQQAQALGQLGQATAMKAQEDKYKFENKYNLLSQKAGAANAMLNTGLSNIFGGFKNIDDSVKSMAGAFTGGGFGK